jgi:hypothetical protein
VLRWEGAAGASGRIDRSAQATADLVFALAPPLFPPHTDNFLKPIKFKSDLGNE